jgi:hypothetical protein
MRADGGNNQLKFYFDILQCSPGAVIFLSDPDPRIQKSELRIRNRVLSGRFGVIKLTYFQYLLSCLKLNNNHTKFPPPPPPEIS